MNTSFSSKIEKNLVVSGTSSSGFEYARVLLGLEAMEIQSLLCSVKISTCQTSYPSFKSQVLYS